MNGAKRRKELNHMTIKRCDKCGEHYEPSYNFPYCDSDPTETCGTVKMTPYFGYSDDQHEFDLCPGCMKELSLWLATKKEANT